MKKLLYTLILISSIVRGDNFEFSHIPIQENGRIKPLDTFAKNQLLSIYTKRSIKSEKLTAIDWLLETLSNPKEAFNKPIFKNSAVALAPPCSLPSFGIPVVSCACRLNAILKPPKLIGKK